MENKTTKALDSIIEEMINKMGEGGMDISYSGHNYKTAKKEAIISIINLIAKINTNYKDQLILAFESQQSKKTKT